MRSSDAKCLRFGLPLQFGLRCKRPRCQIASDVGRAMRATKVNRFPKFAHDISNGGKYHRGQNHCKQTLYKNNQEWPRQTKPKKGQFMNFSQGHSGTKFQCESCLFSQGKTPEFTKMGEIHELFRFGPFFGLVCRGDS